MARKLFLVTLLAISYSCALAQVSFGGTPAKESKKIDDGSDKKIDARLGLLASSLGVPPVPGASYDGIQESDSTAYTGYNPQGGGIHGGNGYGPPSGGPEPIKQCKCTPKEYCLDPGSAAGVLQPPGPGNGTGPGGPGYGGGIVTSKPSGPDYGGGIVTSKPSGPGYGGGNVDPGLQPGGPGYSDGNGGTDGSGVIDIRIVNKPGGVICLAGEVYCCPGSQPSYPTPAPTGYPASPGTCGVRKIIPVNGFTPEYGQASFGAYPWLVVALGPNNNYIGAGALLDNYNVLTAAHKVKDYLNGGFKIRLGEWNAKDDDEPYKNVEVEVARVEIHPAFNPQNLQNDVAIIRLAQPISLDAFPHINSVCLPNQGASFVGSRCWVAGFGKDAFQVGKHSYILREVDVPIVDSNDCENRLRGTRLGSYFNLNRKSFLCAGGEEGKDACTGDGGSPLVCEDAQGKFNVVGLVAWGIGCADYGIPGVYVNVGNYVNWIQSTLYQSQGGGISDYARKQPAGQPKY